MKKFYILAVIIVLLFAAIVFFVTSNVAASTNCVDITMDLSYKSLDSKTDHQVSKLQKYLKTLKYTNTDTIGYFGSSTVAAVKKYQTDYKLNSTGYVGPATRAFIKAKTCTATVTAAASTKSVATTSKATITKAVVKTPAPTIKTITPSSASVGSRITITGTDFATSTMSVIFGGNIISNLKAADNTHLSFIVPQKVGQFVTNPDVYLIGIANSHGTSTTLLNFTVTENIVIQPTIKNISPISGPVGKTITINGSGFAPINNTVTFFVNGFTSTSTGIMSDDGKSLKVKVPSKVSSNCPPASGSGFNQICSVFSQEIKTGDFLVVKVISNKLVSNTANFSVTN